MINLTSTFVLDGERVSITLTDERGNISFTGVFDGGLGQCEGRIREAYDDSAAQSDDIETVLAIWDNRHLQGVDESDFAQHEDIQAAIAALINLDGKRFPEPLEGGRAEDFEDCDFNENDDLLDSRDIMKRIEYLNEFLCDLPDDVTSETYDPADDKNGDRSDAVEERQALRALEDDASGYAPDWQYGETLIHEDYFTDYAEELVKDTAGLPRDIPPYIVIDWEATAENLKVDYTEIVFKGQTFYIR
jgi:hypothetical protein